MTVVEQEPKAVAPETEQAISKANYATFPKSKHEKKGMDSS